MGATSLNTVLTVISLIINKDDFAEGKLSQYRSHGYLFNHGTYSLSTR